jgi:zinc-ribbon domain
MIGTILHFDSANDGGVLRSEDGQRYRFSASDWCSPGTAIAGDVVDFEPVDGQAVEIFVLNRSVAVAAPSVAAPAAALLSNSLTQTIGETKIEARAPEAPISIPMVAMPSGLGARFFVAYFLTIIPTYILPYSLSNSVAFNEGAAAIFGTYSMQFWWHLSCFPVAMFLAFIRGVRIARPWLIAFPFLAGVFDLIPGLNFIPLVPTIMHAVVLFIGASRGAPTGYIPENMNQKFEWGLWALAAYSTYAIYKLWISGMLITGRGNFAGSLLLWPVLGLSVFFALKYRAGDGAAFVKGVMANFGGDGTEENSNDVVLGGSKPVVTEATPDPAHTNRQFCSNCGVSNVLEDRFCAECGSGL